MKVNITMTLWKGTIIIRVHLDMKDTGMTQNYQNMFGNYKSKEKKP